MSMRLSSIAGRAIALLAFVLLLATTSTAAHAAPASFALAEPTNDAYLDTTTPVLAWNATSSPAGIDAYEVRVDGQSIGFVDPADCGSTCAAEVPDPLGQGRHTWQIVAIDGAAEQTSSPLAAFNVDTGSPIVIVFDGARVDADYCAPTPTGVPSLPDGRSLPFVIPPRPVVSIQDASPVTASYRVDGVAVTSLCGLSGGNHSLTTVATDLAGNVATHTAAIRVDAVSPRVTIEGPVRGAINSRSEWRATVADGTAVMPVSRYIWSGRKSLVLGLPGTGGQTSTASFPYPTSGLTEQLRVYVIDKEGDVGIGSIDLTSGGPKPATGTVGVTIKATPKYVNDRRLPLKLIWPSGAMTFTLSDSSGSRAEIAPVTTSNVSWRLGGSGTSRRATTVRARFDWPSPGTVYETKVVLDLERPKLTSATLAGRTLQIKVSDRVSGLHRVQLAVDRRNPRSSSFTTKLRIGSAKWIRVQDRAGNASAWLRIRG